MMMYGERDLSHVTCWRVVFVAPEGRTATLPLWTEDLSTCLAVTWHRYPISAKTYSMHCLDGHLTAWIHKVCPVTLL